MPPLPHRHSLLITHFNVIFSRSRLLARRTSSIAENEDDKKGIRKKEREGERADENLRII